MSDTTESISESIKTLLQESGQGRTDGLVQLASGLLGKMMDDDAPDASAEVERLRRLVRRFKRERVLLRESNRIIAAALGACDCWGADEGCPRCRGAGAPGYLIPVEEAFVSLIVPLLEARRDIIAPYLESRTPEANRPEQKRTGRSTSKWTATTNTKPSPSQTSPS